MPLEEAVVQSVAFIVDDRGWVIGTGFLVAFNEDGLPFWYIVTAAHVVASDLDDDGWVPVNGTQVRVRQHEGPPKDLPVDAWVFHPTADVAITPYVPSEGANLKPYGIGPGTVSMPSEARPGEIVYFVGQLYYVPRMAEQNIPMVRSGTVGVMYQDHIPVDWFGTGDPDEVREVFGHLIDCRSYSGFSGSPCFTQRQIGGTGHDFGGIMHVSQHVSTHLFGVVSGHFPQPEKVRMSGEPGSDAYVDISAGVAIVTPVERLVELLDDSEVQAMRKQDAEERRAAQRRSIPPAVGDKAPSEFKNFEELTKKLVQVPKSEIDAKRKRD